jgi:hypothetical protein
MPVNFLIRKSGIPLRAFLTGEATSSMDHPEQARVHISSFLLSPGSQTNTLYVGSTIYGIVSCRPGFFLFIKTLLSFHFF